METSVATTSPNGTVANKPEKDIVNPNDNITKSIKEYFTKEDVRKKFNELLGKRAAGFITSVLQICASNDLLRNADPQSVYSAAATAAALDLPLNNNLGFAYIVPYNTRYTDDQGLERTKQVATFQMGYKGFVQLAQRSGQFKTLSACEIYEGQLIEENPLTGFVFDFTKKTSDTVIGYASYFKLINGFEITWYMKKEDVDKHGKKYSQTYRKGFGLWKTDFDSMAKKTALKLLLSKYAPLSIEMQRAIISDQAIINDVETLDATYIDHTPAPAQLKSQEEHEAERINIMIGEAKTIAELETLRPHVTDANTELFADRLNELKEMRMEQGKKIREGGAK